MTDELELVHEDHLEDRRGVLSPSTMDAISTALRHVLPLRRPRSARTTSCVLEHL